MVFSGYIAGKRVYESGSGSNYLCTHESPRAGPNNVPGTQYMSARFSGVEFDLDSPYGNNQPFSNANFREGNVHGQDLLCALCYRPKRSYSVMIPGRHDCGLFNSDWTLEYKGYLAAAYSYNTFQRTAYTAWMKPRKEDWGERESAV